MYLKEFCNTIFLNLCCKNVLIAYTLWNVFYIKQFINKRGIKI